MGYIKKGILGGFSGKVGSVVGVRWRNRNLMRSLPSASSKPPTKEQVEQRSKFAVVIRFLSPISNIVGRFFGRKQGDKSPFNLAVSYHLRDAVIEDGDAFVIDYEKVVISKGDLQGLQGASLTPQADQELELTWTDNSGQGLATATDKLIVVTYAPQMEDFESFIGIATRADGTVAIQMPAYFAGISLQCWASFITENEKLAATSSYLGEVVVL